MMVGREQLGKRGNKRNVIFALTKMGITLSKMGIRSSNLDSRHLSIIPFRWCTWKGIFLGLKDTLSQKSRTNRSVLARCAYLRNKVRSLVDCCVCLGVGLSPQRTISQSKNNCWEGDQNSKRTTPGIPTWSPTVVLTCIFCACLGSSPYKKTATLPHLGRAP